MRVREKGRESDVCVCICVCRRLMICCQISSLVYNIITAESIDTNNLSASQSKVKLR